MYKSIITANTLVKITYSMLFLTVLVTKEYFSYSLLLRCWAKLSYRHLKIQQIIKGLKSVYGIQHLNVIGDMCGKYLCSYNNEAVMHLDATNGYWVIQSVLGFLVNECANRQDREYPQIVNFILSEEAMNFNVCTALVSALKIERADCNGREVIGGSKIAADGILSPPLVCIGFMKSFKTVMVTFPWFYRRKF